MAAKETVRLWDFINERSIVTRRTFEDSIVEGPAVIAPLEGVTFSNCIFEGDADSMFIEVETDRTLIGCVGLVEVTFERCRFRNIGIIGPPAAREMFLKALGDERTAPHPHQHSRAN